MTNSKHKERKNFELNLMKSRYRSGAEIVGPITDAPVRQKRSAKVQSKMLDVAEFLFAKWGYAGVSVRDVTSVAEMRMANVSYYFGSKQNLYYEVLRRRAEPLMKMRLERIRSVRAKDLSGHEKLRSLIAAYSDPPLELSESDDEGWKNFFSLIGQITFTGFAATEISDFFNQPARELMSGFRDIYPEKPLSEIQAVTMMLIGPYILVLSETGRIETFPEREYSSSDIGFLGPKMKEFMLGGIIGVLGAPVEKV